MVLQPPPPGFKDNKFQFSFQVKTNESHVWNWLNDTKTFTDTQYWPYRVEFYSPNPEDIPNGFNEGVVTNHHGPLINFAGVLTTVKPNYRDLQYTYGSYALSFRWIRPYRLEFKTSANGDELTEVECTLSAYVKPSWEKIWVSGQKWFWGSFKRWAGKSILKKAKQSTTEK